MAVIDLDEYRWEGSFHCDNNETMYDFLNNHFSENWLSEFEVIEDDGSLCIVKLLETGDDYILRSMGDGDSFNHKVTLEKMTDQEEK